MSFARFLKIVFYRTPTSDASEILKSELSIQKRLLGKKNIYDDSKQDLMK